MLLADDHTIFCQRLAERLSTDESIEVVGEAENGEEVVKLARETLSNVVVLDVKMPDGGAGADGPAAQALAAPGS